MKYFADLHVHSRHSRATSPEMSPGGLWRAARMKGIGVLGTGDFTHPEWIEELREKLEPAEEGLFRLSPRFRGGDVPASCPAEALFMLQAEVSSIYKKNGRTRKVHSLIFAPGFEEAQMINARLAAIGNIRSDGRPILGLDARALLEIVLESSPEAMVVPAHAWTPHFSVFGSASGFDSLEECYEDLTPLIRAIETGLSSDPPMNRMLSALDGITLISNSDAHSPLKLGREANIIETSALSYASITNAIKGVSGEFKGTLEFFPEEGKYHVDGHRKCGVSMLPEETRRHGMICPSCGRRLTIGVLHRVEDLADRKAPADSSFTYVIPLAEIIAQVKGRGVNTKGVQEEYLKLISELGSEFHILLEATEGDISRAGGEELAAAIMRMRRGEVSVEPGYDGVYGRISVSGAPLKAKRKTSPGRRGAGSKGGQSRLF